MTTFAPWRSHPPAKIMRKKLIFDNNTGVHVDWAENLPDEGNFLAAEYKILGMACDDEEFGDRCDTWCELFVSGTCPAGLIRDCDGKLWHIIGPGTMEM